MTATFAYRLKYYGLKPSMKDLFMWVDCLCVIGGILMIVFWILYVDKLGDVQAGVVDVTVTRPERLPSKRVEEYWKTMKTYEASVMGLNASVTRMVALVDLYRTGITMYALLILFRFFKAFRSQPRLAIVTNTLIGCAVDFIHFFIVFWTMFMSYVLASMFLFGHRLAEFSNTDQAVTKCFLVLLGDFDFDELMEENPTTAALWFYTFLVFMMLLLLNMSLAIIMDVYSEAKGNAALSDAIWEQVAEMWTEARSASNGRIKNVEIMKVLVEMDVEYVSPNTLMEAIPLMSEDQARELISKVEILELADDETSLTLADALKLITSTKMNVQTIDTQLTGYMMAQKETRKVAGNAGSLMSPRTAAGTQRLHPASDKRIRLVETRLEFIETALNEAMAYMVYRGKELRNKLKGLEDKLRFQRDAASNANSELWANPAILGGRSSSPPPPAKVGNVTAPGRPMPMTFSA